MVQNSSVHIEVGLEAKSSEECVEQMAQMRKTECSDDRSSFARSSKFAILFPCEPLLLELLLELPEPLPDACVCWK